MRNVYFQSPENPVQLDRLPDSRPDTELPLHEYTPREDRFLALKVAGRMILLTAVTDVVQFFKQRSSLTLIGSCTTLEIIAFLGVLGYLLGQAIRRRQFLWLRTPLAAVAVAFAYLVWQPPLPVHLIITAGALSLLTQLIGLHWIAYCTASPLDRNVAGTLREQCRSHLLVASAAPLVATLVGLFTGSVKLAVIIAISLPLGQLVANFTSIRSILRVARNVLVSWIAYNRNDRTWPGMFSSPAGSWTQRIVVTCTTVFLFAIGSVRAASEAEIPALQPEALVARFTSLSSAWHASDDPNVTVSLIPPSLAMFAFEVIGLLLLFFTLGVVIPFLIGVFFPLHLYIDFVRFRQPAVTPNDWGSFVQDIQSSTDPTERESVFIGRVVHGGSPVLVPRTVFSEHAHFLGDSGSGKTSLGLCPVIEQLLASGTCSLVLVDLKADSLELLEAARAAVQRAEATIRRPIGIKHFTNETSKSTFAFNPLQQSYWKDLTLYQRTDILCAALGLSYGPDYGEGFYGSANAEVLYQTMKLYPDVATFEELSERLRYVLANAKNRDLHAGTRKAGTHVQTVINRLASFEALNVIRGNQYPEEVINNGQSGYLRR